MTIERLPGPGMRHIGAIVQNIVNAAAKAKADRRALKRAHEAAEEFHAALGHALFYEDILESDKESLQRAQERRDPDIAQYEADIAETEKSYAQALGDAAVALQKMPVKWAAILGAELPVVAQKAAAE